MPADTPFAPYRPAPGALPEDAARAAAEHAAEPLVADPSCPLPVSLVTNALAGVAAGRASTDAEACRAADGSVAGGAGPALACLSSEHHAKRVAEAAREALGAGFAGLCLDRPDEPLVLGLLGAGFCPECQRELARHLAREYGDHFQPLDYLAVAREAVARSRGAVSFEHLPFGRDFWRVRNEALVRAVSAHARAARDSARRAGRPFDVVAHFEAVGPAQLRASRHLDSAIFPAPPGDRETGIGRFRLMRAALGRRSCAAAIPASSSPAGRARLAAVAATCGVDLATTEPSGAPGLSLPAIRRLSRRLRRNSLSPEAGEPVAECAILYSTEADLWTGGRHLVAVERAAELLAAEHLQAPVVMSLRAAAPQAAIVLADAACLSPLEANEVRASLEGGASVLAFGEPTGVDEVGRPGAPFLPQAKESGSRVGRGTLALLPPLAPDAGHPQPPALERALGAILHRGPRAAALSASEPVLVVAHRSGRTVLVHLVALGEKRVEGARLRLGDEVASGARRGRLVSADGADVRIPVSASGASLSIALPGFAGYAVLSLAP